MEPPEGEPTRDEIIDSYIKTLAQIVGSEEEARQKIYSVSTKHYFAFGALVSEELSYKIKTLPRVRWVLPDSYLDVKNKDYGGEPFIDGKAVPYDPKYHEEWVRNNARANERSRRNDRPRNFDRSRNFERRRENMQSRDFQNRPPPEFQNREGQNPMQGTPPPMPNRDAPPNPSFQGAPYQNQGPPYQGNYMPQMQSPEFQNREGQSPPPYTPGPPPQGGPYQNQGPGYQANYAPNNAPGGNAYQGGGNFYQRGGGPHQGGGNPQQGGGNTYQGGGGGGGAYQVGGNGFQGGGGNGYPGPDSAYQASGGNSFQARDVRERLTGGKNSTNEYLVLLNGACLFILYMGLASMP
ncbi:unnamed protein product [Spirodela intermedia]|uniref:MORF/ORRM1/DAG-like MORF domain-containing protein n=1 Tax=Spirodela intermedia TaxID=51605 RepID=A0A7I8J6H7_SPIIN|nr:unnamed protein product [Spirodela intermedia]CAA6665847.1 unnamed protein product [Spirodela intermedia]